ncbi:hypothetical protein EJB05_43280, partial [Eragrostis curvula]
MHWTDGSRRDDEWAVGRRTRFPPALLAARPRQCSHHRTTHPARRLFSKTPRPRHAPPRAPEWTRSDSGPPALPRSNPPALPRAAATAAADRPVLRFVEAIRYPVLFKMVKYTRNKKTSSRELRSSHHKKLWNHCSFKRVVNQERTFAEAEKCAWKDATCPVCMEIPHNAVLLLCSSHDNGCRPYICASNFQLSNCLDQLVESCKSVSSKDPDSIEFVCPLCRGAVKGYTLVEPARKQLNQKRRSCMQDGCSYMGTYRQLCKHVRKKHPSGNPRAVDPQQAVRWNRLLFRTSVQDMICSTNSPVVRRVLSALLQYEEYMASVWRQNGGPHGANNDNTLRSANAGSDDP